MARKKKDATPADNVTTQPTARRVYEMLHQETGKIRMIESTSQARALRFVSRDTWSVKSCTGSDVARNVRAGVVIEEDYEPEPTPGDAQ